METNALAPVFEAVSSYFALLSEPMRLRILHAICDEEKTVSQIVTETGATQTNVSRHLSTMYRAGALNRRKEGNFIWYGVRDSALTEICRTVCNHIAARGDPAADPAGLALFTKRLGSPAALDVGVPGARRAKQARAPANRNDEAAETGAAAMTQRETAADRQDRGAPMSGRVRPAPESTLSAGQLAQARRVRRAFMAKALALGAGVAGAGRAVARPVPGEARGVDGPGEKAVIELPAHTTGLGQPVAARGYGAPSQWESNLQRRESPGLTRVSAASVSFTPLQGMFGIITPNGLHFERHHQGWWDIDPGGHRLMVHGLVREARVFTMDDLMRLPSVSRIHFIECGANTGMEWANVAVPTVQYTHGMLACCEFTGVRVSTLLDLCGADLAKGRYVLAEGADGSSMTRTIAMERALDDAIVAWGMNGEMLRPENGYPLRLVVPGVQGVSWVKYLRRLEVGDQPWYTKDEVLHYVDLMPDGLHRQFTSIQEVKSVVTTPSGGQVLLDKGYYNVSGLAWSGRGRIRRVDVSFDGGRNWRQARLEEPVLSKALTRFNVDWTWDGSPAIVQSRATDERGQVQPKINQLRAVRGTRSIYHNNAIQSWRVAESGEVFNVQAW